MFSYKSVLTSAFLLQQIGLSLEWVPISPAQAFQQYGQFYIVNSPFPTRIPNAVYIPYVVRVPEMNSDVDFSKPKTQTLYKSTLVPSESPVYEFRYKVHDPNKENYQEKSETRIGDTVKGYYTVREPNGYIRLVKYVSNEKGFQTQVSHYHAGDNAEGNLSAKK